MALGESKPASRNQMNRLFSCTVSLIYEDDSGFTRVTSPVADKHEFWWNERKPGERVLWEASISTSGSLTGPSRSVLRSRSLGGSCTISLERTRPNSATTTLFKPSVTSSPRVEEDQARLAWVELTRRPLAS